VPSLRALSSVIEDTIVRKLYVLQRVGEWEELSNDLVMGSLDLVARYMG